MTKKKKLIILFFVSKIITSAVIFLVMAKVGTDIPKEEFMPKKEPKTIVAFGDSLTAGYGLDEQYSYPTILKTKLNSSGFDNYVVENMGISGETSTGALKRVDDVLQKNPDLVILETGINDNLRKVDPKITKENVAKIIEQLKENNIKVILVGSVSPWSILGDQNEFNNIYPELAAKYNIDLIPFFLDGVALNPQLNLEDRIHPNAKGYAYIVENNIWPILKKEL